MKYSERQEYWKSKGYTDENIQNHLIWERRRAKEVRERKKKNNEANKELIKQIKNELVGKTFYGYNEKMEITILSIRESVDGAGFWYKMNKKFSDGSCGEFREFSYFEEYNLKDFIKYIFI